jgi:hypothetical protein
MAQLYEENAPPIRAQAYTYRTALQSVVDPDNFQVNPTLNAGDVIVYKDGVLDGNIDTLPTAIGATELLNVTLSVAEMTCNCAEVKWKDVLGNEWKGQVNSIRTVDLVTAPTVTVASIVNGGKVTVRPFSTWVIPISGVGSLAGRTKLWFGVKDDPATQLDSASLLMVEETAGLQYINGAVGVGGNATLVVTDPVAGDFTVTVNKSQTGLPPRAGRVWQLKMGIAAGADTVIAEGEFNIGQTVTRTTA